MSRSTLPCRAATIRLLILSSLRLTALTLSTQPLAWVFMIGISFSRGCRLLHEMITTVLWLDEARDTCSKCSHLPDEAVHDKHQGKSLRPAPTPEFSRDNTRRISLLTKQISKFCTATEACFIQARPPPFRSVSKLSGQPGSRSRSPRHGLCVCHYCLLVNFAPKERWTSSLLQIRRRPTTQLNRLV